MRSTDLEQKQYEDIFKLEQKYKINVSEPTDMMLRDVEAYGDPGIVLDNWFNKIVKLNGEYVKLYHVSISQLSGIPFAYSTRSNYAIPFDCFEEYQTIFCNPIEDSSDVDFF